MRSILIFTVADTISAPVLATKESRENPTTGAVDRSARELALQAGTDPNVMDRNDYHPLQWSGDQQDRATMLAARSGVTFCFSQAATWRYLSMDSNL